MADMYLPRLNKVILSGRIANDIELRFTAKGTPVCKFTLAVDKPSRKDEQGNYQKQDASFLDIVAWSKQAEAVRSKAHKGSPIIVEGRIEARNYTDSNNVNRKAVEIVAEYIQFLEKSTSAENAQVDEPVIAENATTETGDDVPF